ncbi:MAG: glycoside hydrolase family 31 protein [Halieaceae bacterium]|nr:glycoside hydrolase family 31 protein [Halieaceae bacterium]
MPRLLWLLLFVTFPAPAAEYLSHQVEGSEPRVTFATTEFAVDITALNSGAVSVEYQDPARTAQPSYALPEMASFDGKMTVLEQDSSIEIRLPKLLLKISKSPFAISYWRNDELLFAEAPGYFSIEGMLGFRFKLQDSERFWGGGERILGMDRRGHRLPLENKPHYGYTTESQQMYYSMPAVMSERSYLIAFDNPAKGVMDIADSTPNILQFEAPAGRSGYLVVADDSLLELARQWVEVTGKQPLPPRWALGSFASRFGYRNQAEAEAVVQRYKDVDVPLDVIVLDLYWFGETIQGTMGNLDWHAPAWPAPETMISKFSDQGVKTVLITEPFILTNSKEWPNAKQASALAKTVDGEPRTFDFYFGHSGLVDVFGVSGQEWFWSIYERLLNQGVAGFWGDLGEPEVHPNDTVHSAGSALSLHNAYGHSWAKLLYERMSERLDQRPFIMMRSGFLGSQRYGMIPWTGDVDRSWGGLSAQVELSLQMSAMGLAYIHSDLGGFAGGETFDAELYYRWLAMGVFSPVFRPHAQDHIPSEPVFHDQDTVDKARGLIKLRYRLLPYLYSLAYENTTKGTPIVRSTAYYGTSEQAFVDASRYYFGDALLVQPVTEPNQASVEVRLPRDNQWFNFWTGDALSSHQIQQDINSVPIPVYAKAGAFIPMLVEAPQSTASYDSSNLELRYYHDTSVMEAQSQLFDDDGLSASSLNSDAYEISTFKASWDDSKLTFDLQNAGGDYAGRPTHRSIRLVVHGWRSFPRNVDVNNRKVVGVTYDQAAKILVVPVALPADSEVTVEIR